MINSRMPVATISGLGGREGGKEGEREEVQQHMETI